MINAESHTVLVVEDDSSLREVLEMGLSREGLRVVSAEDGVSALAEFRAADPAIVLLDLMLPGKDGIEVCREIRKISEVPIIMLTARTSTVDVVVGLEAGADDYVTKPFEFPELVARIRAALRRMQHGSAGKPATHSGSAPETHKVTLTLGPVEIDERGHTVFRRGDGADRTEIPLTATEFRLLLELARERGHVLSREQLLDRVWGYDFLGDSRLVDVHVQRLRSKIESDPGHPRLILTVRGAGYKAAEVS